MIERLDDQDGQVREAALEVLTVLEPAQLASHLPTLLPRLGELQDNVKRPTLRIAALAMRVEGDAASRRRRKK